VLVRGSEFIVKRPHKDVKVITIININMKDIKEAITEMEDLMTSGGYFLFLAEAEMLDALKPKLKENGHLDLKDIITIFHFVSGKKDLAIIFVKQTEIVTELFKQHGYESDKGNIMVCYTIGSNPTIGYHVEEHKQSNVKTLLMRLVFNEIIKRFRDDIDRN
jgi:hypothetical protein